MSPGFLQRPAIVFRGTLMEYFIAGLISLAIGVYLLYALLKPEKF
jgi:K+-transporting ATPase KdpF subunit